MLNWNPIVAEQGTLISDVAWHVPKNAVAPVGITSALGLISETNKLPPLQTPEELAARNDPEFQKALAKTNDSFLSRLSLTSAARERLAYEGMMTKQESFGSVESGRISSLLSR